MAWNEPGNNGKNNDPWNQGGRNQGPPDMDDVFRDLGKKLGGIFGGGSSSGSNNGSSSAVIGLVAGVESFAVSAPSAHISRLA